MHERRQRLLLSSRAGATDPLLSWKPFPDPNIPLRLQDERITGTSGSSRGSNRTHEESPMDAARRVEAVTAAKQRRAKERQQQFLHRCQRRVATVNRLRHQMGEKVEHSLDTTADDDDWPNTTGAVLPNRVDRAVGSVVQAVDVSSPSLRDRIATARAARSVIVSASCARKNSRLQTEAHSFAQQPQLLRHDDSVAGQRSSGPQAGGAVPPDGHVTTPMSGASPLSSSSSASWSAESLHVQNASRQASMGLASEDEAISSALPGGPWTEHEAVARTLDVLEEQRIHRHHHGKAVSWQDRRQGSADDRSAQADQRSWPDSKHNHGSPSKSDLVRISILARNDVNGKDAALASRRLSVRRHFANMERERTREMQWRAEHRRRRNALAAGREHMRASQRLLEDLCIDVV